MSCCPTPPEVKIGDSSDNEDPSIADNEMRQGETTECYLRRASNPTGLHDDATAYQPDKIKNNDIPLTGGDTANTRFELTPGSTKKATSWTITAKETAIPSQVKFASAGQTATLIGTFPKDSYGKKFKFEVTALAGTEVIDIRGYVFSPSKSTASDEIRFVMPLPGGICNSPFSSARMHPVKGIVKPHWGADFKMANKSVVDVVAAADGEVVFTGYQDGGAGNYIKIEHLNASGKHLCTTVYMHLSSIYVKTGQRVVAGQKIGREGSTGSSTGNHLHFECRLPNGDRIDPVPLIRGTIQVAAVTTSTNDAASLVPQNTGAALTPQNVDAKQDGCEPFGDTYPRRDKNDKSVAELLKPPAGSVFEKAWFLTMKNEVNPNWSEAYLTDPDVIKGLINTAEQRAKVGYVNHPNDTGGETKFGIAQKYNTKVIVRDMPFDVAQKIGFNDYWIRAKCEEMVTNKKPKTAVMYFDITFLCGNSSKTILSNANVNGLSDEAACDALYAAWVEHLKGLVEKNPRKSVFLKGWMRRTVRTLAYAKAI